MDKHNVYTTINRSCNVLKVNPSEKKNIWCKTYAKTEDHNKLKLLFQFLAYLAPILGTTENVKFTHFMKKSMHWKTEFFVRLSSLVRASK